MRRYIAGYERLLSIDRNDVQACQELAQLLLDVGRLPEAERELEAVLHQDSHLAAAHKTLGRFG